jgi:two-component system cell cycle response regulator
MVMSLPQVLLIDASENRSVLAQRLGMQGYAIELADGPAQGARMALAKPPAVIVADLWMPSISGVQLCRLLTSETATRHVPVILRGPWGHRDRFWAERAGAHAYVARGRMGDLVRAIERALASQPRHSVRPPSTTIRTDADVRDRIAAELDQALFESVIASEIRGLAALGDFERLFDRFSQLLTQITSYRWCAITTRSPERFAIHAHPRLASTAETEARAALALEHPPSVRIEDEDPFAEPEGPAAIVEPIRFGGTIIGDLAVACKAPAHPGDRPLVATIARELGGPMRMVSLVEESQLQARVDALTGLLNRRAFVPALTNDVARSGRYGTPLSVLLVDVDHFKHVNDRFGHAVGDQVLAAMGRLLGATLRTSDVVARWGGEEFVAMLPCSDLAAARQAAERLRAGAEALVVETTEGTRVPITISVGVAQFEPADNADGLIDRADRAMYLAKTSGRNRVEAAPYRGGPASEHTGEGTPMLHA